MNTLKFIVVVSIALLSTDLIYHQVDNGYLPLDTGRLWFKESEFVIQYCREHASDANPVQDLVDKIIITWGWFNGETCVTVKQAHDAYLQQVPPT
jgi:hypothetical protein